MHVDRLLFTAALVLGSALMSGIGHAQEGGSRLTVSRGATESGEAAEPAAGVPSMELAPGITFEVTELRRMADKRVTQLRFVVANDSGSDVTLKELGMAYGSYLSDIDLIDLAARKSYTIGSASGCLCSTFKDNDGGVVRTGERRQFWAWYAGLPAGTKEVALQAADQPPLMNLLVQ